MQKIAIILGINTNRNEIRTNTINTNIVINMAFVLIDGFIVSLCYSFRYSIALMIYHLLRYNLYHLAKIQIISLCASIWLVLIHYAN